MTYDDSADSYERQICTAIRRKNMDELHMLLLEDVDLNKLDAYGKKMSSKMTPLHIAVSTKNFDAVKLLIKFKVDVNIKAFPSGNTALHIAAMWALPLIVDALLEAGADPVINNQKNKNPLQIIGTKYRSDNMEDDVLEGKMETQILLLHAGGKRATKFQNDLDADIEDAEDGLRGLKAESNSRIKTIERAQGEKFTATHPFLYCKSARMKAWKSKNKCTVQEYLGKRYIKVKVPQWEDRKIGVVHIDLSKVQSFQLAIAKELLLKSGLKLLPENKPKLPKGVKSKKEKATKNRNKAKSKKVKVNNTLKTVTY